MKSVFWRTKKELTLLKGCQTELLVIQALISGKENVLKRNFVAIVEEIKVSNCFKKIRK